MPDAPQIELVVVQPTPFCNIDCAYCYLPNRSDKSVVADATLDALFTKIFASDWTAPEISVIWHAGEPLVLPPSFYERAFARIEAMRPERVRVAHSFQTNGMLINPAWCDLFKAWDVRVGVSIDGPKHLHDARRMTRSGQGTFDKAVAGVRLLRAHQVPFHVISVLTRAGMQQPRELLDFYLAEGIREVCFNVEESEGSHVSDLFAADDAKPLFTTFLTEFWRMAHASGAIGSIREIDSMLARIFRPDEIVVRNEQVEPLAMLNVDCHGNVSTFSPELLGLRNADYDDFLIGNIVRDTLEQMLASPNLARMAHDIGAGVDACRSTCEYFSVCGGGAPVNKLSENERFDSTRTRFCELTAMVPTDLILASLDRLDATRGSMGLRTHAA